MKLLIIDGDFLKKTGRRKLTGCTCAYPTYLCGVTKQDVFSISTDAQFEDVALAIFRQQAQNNPVYHDFIAGLRIDPLKIKTVTNIPFLPIEFFKSHPVVSTTDQAEVMFTSSGTTGMITSSHYVNDVSWYEESFRKAFSIFYGDIKDHTVLALLPSYLEREGSSLIYMANDLIQQSGNPDSDFSYTTMTS